MSQLCERWPESYGKSVPRDTCVQVGLVRETERVVCMLFLCKLDVIKRLSIVAFQSSSSICRGDAG